MVRKVKSLFICVALLLAFATVAHAETYTAYDGNISTTYITYFRDIVSGIKFNDNYVAFRAGERDYRMAVGDISYNSGTFNADTPVKVYVFSSSESSYNSYYKYSVLEQGNFRLDPGDNVIYSDLGDYPQLVERGAKYEMLSAVLFSIALLGFVVRQFFSVR